MPTISNASASPLPLNIRGSVATPLPTAQDLATDASRARGVDDSALLMVRAQQPTLRAQGGSRLQLADVSGEMSLTKQSMFLNPGLAALAQPGSGAQQVLALLRG